MQHTNTQTACGINGQQFCGLSLTCTELSARRALTHTHHININEAITEADKVVRAVQPLQTSCCHTQTCCSSTLTHHEETAVISLLYRFTASSIKMCVLPTYCWFQLYNPVILNGNRSIISLANHRCTYSAFLQLLVSTFVCFFSLLFWFAD